MKDKEGVKKTGTIWTKPFIAIFMVALFQTMGQYMAHTLVPYTRWPL